MLQHWYFTVDLQRAVHSSEQGHIMRFTIHLASTSSMLGLTYDSVCQRPLDTHTMASIARLRWLQFSSITSGLAGS